MPHERGLPTRRKLQQIASLRIISLLLPAPQNYKTPVLGKRDPNNLVSIFHLPTEYSSPIRNILAFLEDALT